LPLDQSGVGRAGIEPATDSRRIRSALSPLSYRPVGHRGVEPRHTRLSDGPRRPAGSWPAEDGGVEPHGTRSRAGVQGQLARRRGIFLKRIAEVSHPSACAPTRVRVGGRTLAASLSRCGGRSIRSPARYARPFAFQTTPTPWPVHPPTRRVEKSNPTACAAHSLAARPGAWPVHSPCVRREGFEPSRPKTHGSGPCAATLLYATSA
jgi:hypothetical protein